MDTPGPMDRYEFKPYGPIDLGMVNELIEIFTRGWMDDHPPAKINAFSEILRLVGQIAEMRKGWTVSLRTTYYVDWDVTRVNASDLFVDKGQLDNLKQGTATGGPQVEGVVEGILEVNIRHLFTMAVQDDPKVQTVPCFMLSHAVVNNQQWGPDRWLIVPFLFANAIEARVMEDGYTAIGALIAGSGS